MLEWCFLLNESCHEIWCSDFAKLYLDQCTICENISILTRLNLLRLCSICEWFITLSNLIVFTRDFRRMFASSDKKFQRRHEFRHLHKSEFESVRLAWWKHLEYMLLKTNRHVYTYSEISLVWTRSCHRFHRIYRHFFRFYLIESVSLKSSIIDWL
jgi:hypothetical protein